MKHSGTNFVKCSDEQTFYVITAWLIWSEDLNRWHAFNKYCEIFAKNNTSENHFWKITSTCKIFLWLCSYIFDYSNSIFFFATIIQLHNHIPAILDENLIISKCKSKLMKI